MNQFASALAIEDAPRVPRRNMPLEERLVSYKRVPGPKMQHRLDWIASELAIDPHFDSVTIESWGRWRDAWKVLGPDGDHEHAMKVSKVLED